MPKTFSYDPRCMPCYTEAKYKYRLLKLNQLRELRNSFEKEFPQTNDTTGRLLAVQDLIAAMP